MKIFNIRILVLILFSALMMGSTYHIEKIPLMPPAIFVDPDPWKPHVGYIVEKPNIVINDNHLRFYQHGIKIRATKKDLKCLALNIYHEAATEDDAGKYAVAQVTLNRVVDSRFSSSICDVVYFRVTKRYVSCAFSWVCQEVNDPEGPNWRRSIEVAEDVLYHGIGLHTVKDALFYHATYIDLPYWADVDKEIIRIGLHIFYADALMARRPMTQVTSNI